ncbi:hypothetical protein TSMEX_001148 [Taenia solium]|eukprot:TsM_000279200 transcript=TsM_000279200 gene=TsM_000279200
MVVPSSSMNISLSFCLPPFPSSLGYGPPLVQPTGSPTAELRGRIRRLICRSRKNPHHFRYFSSSYPSA